MMFDNIILVLVGDSEKAKKLPTYYLGKVKIQLTIALFSHVHALIKIVKIYNL